MEEIYNGPIKYIDSSDKMELIIPSDSNMFLVIVLTPFILIWMFVEFFVFPFIILPNFQYNSFILTFFCGWTGIGVVFNRLWLWHAIGRSKITIQNNSLTIRKQNDVFSKKKIFDINKIERLFIQNRDIERTKYNIRPNYLFTNKTNTVAFIYGQQTIRVVDWLNTTDANYVLKKLKIKVHS